MSNKYRKILLTESQRTFIKKMLIDEKLLIYIAKQRSVTLGNKVKSIGTKGYLQRIIKEDEYYEVHSHVLNEYGTLYKQYKNKEL